MKDWYLAKSSRDRMIIVAVAFLALLTLLYVLVWHPLNAKIEQRRLNVASGETNLEYMLQGQARIRASGGGATGQQMLTSDKAPYLLIDEIIRKAGIKLPERVEPTGKDGARVQFSEVEFDKLVSVIAELERYGLNVSTLNVSRKANGIVSARFNMERG